MWEDVPQSTVLTGSLNRTGQVVPWAVEQLPMPRSNSAGHESHSGHSHSDTQTAPNQDSSGTTINLDSVVVLAWSDYGLVPKAVELGVAVHMGKYLFTWANIWG